MTCIIYHTLNYLLMGYQNDVRVNLRIHCMPNSSFIIENNGCLTPTKWKRKESI
jgi:hypothetical protein